MRYFLASHKLSSSYQVAVRLSQVLSGSQKYPSTPTPALSDADEYWSLQSALFETKLDHSESLIKPVPPDDLAIASQQLQRHRDVLVPRLSVRRSEWRWCLLFHQFASPSLYSRFAQIDQL